jgi:hypothetical protein
MEHYFGQISPNANWKVSKDKLWRSADVFGKEGSSEKEAGIRKRIII